MKIPTKGATIASALALLASLFLGVVELPPVANAIPTSIGIVQQVPLAPQIRFLPKRQDGPKWSQAEAEAKERQDAHQKPKDGDAKLVKSADKKQVTTDKIQGARNVQKRENNHKTPPKTPKVKKRR